MSELSMLNENSETNIIDFDRALFRKYAYTLNGKEPIPTSNTQVIAELIDSGEAFVAYDEKGDIIISTMFTGFDASHGQAAKPVVFDLRVLKSGECVEHHDYDSWEEAEVGHKEMAAKYHSD